jgi:multiple sugar transport system substrate-binding protein
MLKKLLLSATFAVMASASAHATCAYQNTVPLKSLSAGFEAWKAVTGAMAECGEFQPELDQDFGQKQPAAFAAKPALYQIGGVATESIIPLLQDGTIRPLDEFVAKYGQNLQPNQLITIDGKIMAIAMMVNTQHLIYRSDILSELGIEPPKTYDELLAAAKKIKDAGKLEYPIGGTFKTGWNLGEEFVNMYLGYGGKFFDEHNNATVNNEAGVKTLETLKALSGYMDPEFLVADSTVVQQQFQQGKIALTNLWASRAGALEDPKESTVTGKIGVGPAPAAVAGGKPATTIWWDGATIAKNITDEQADAAFKLLMEGLDTDMVKANNDAAVWIVAGYQPNALAQGAFQSAKLGAPAYPASVALGILHEAFGNHTPDFLTGKKSAEQTLADIEAAYQTSAKEKGLIQ